MMNFVRNTYRICLWIRGSYRIMHLSNNNIFNNESIVVDIKCVTWYCRCIYDCFNWNIFLNHDKRVFYDLYKIPCFCLTVAIDLAAKNQKYGDWVPLFIFKEFINPNNTIFDAKGLIERKYTNHWPFKVGNHGGITILEIEYKSDQNRVVGISIVNVQDKVDQQL